MLESTGTSSIAPLPPSGHALPLSSRERGRRRSGGVRSSPERLVIDVAEFVVEAPADVAGVVDDLPAAALVGWLQLVLGDQVHGALVHRFHAAVELLVEVAI